MLEQLPAHLPPMVASQCKPNFQVTVASSIRLHHSRHHYRHCHHRCSEFQSVSGASSTPLPDLLVTTTLLAFAFALSSAGVPVCSRAYATGGELLTTSNSGYRSGQNGLKLFASSSQRRRIPCIPRRASSHLPEANPLALLSLLVQLVP
jgi:hypothetical protein